jgi:hypothetical protein
MQAFLIKPAGQAYLVTEISPTANPNDTPTIQLSSWTQVEDLLVRRGATRDALTLARNHLDQERETQVWF